jgi:hypothetical protein
MDGCDELQSISYTPAPRFGIILVVLGIILVILGIIIVVLGIILVVIGTSERDQ